MQEAIIRPALQDPLFDLRIVAHQHFEVNIGKILLKPTDHIGQPVGGNAGKGRNGNGTRHQSPQLPCCLTALLGLCHQLPHGGQQPQTFSGRRYPLPSPPQQRESDFVFK